MKLNYLVGAAVATALLAHTPAQAEREPSQHVRCDGNPNNVGTGETVARLIGAVTLLGLFAPPPEAADHSARLSGADGVAACSAALAGEENEVRRAQLILARAIHRIEAGEHDAAIADAELVGRDRPAFAQTSAYRLSLGLSAIEIRALALLAAGRTEEAVSAAHEMADAAPYDLFNVVRAWRFVRLRPTFGPAEDRFYERLVRLYPSGLAERAAARELAGDRAAAAADYELLSSMVETVAKRPASHALGHAAINRALLGEGEAAERLAAAAQADIDSEVAAGRGGQLTNARELLDFYNIVRRAQSGSVAEARLLFAARSSWAAPSPAAVGTLARLLQAGAEPAQLNGLLAGDPDRFQAVALTTRQTELAEEARSGKNRFLAMRAFTPQRSYSAFAGNVWREGRSRYFSREEKAEVRARFVTSMRDGGGAPSGYALLLHSALTAQREGRSTFMLLPGRSNVSVSFVRTGNPGDAGLFAPVSFEAERVIADLSPLIPRPVREARAR